MNHQADDLGQKLLCAILHGDQINHIRDLIDHGANLEATDVLGETPLLKATVLTLLEAGADTTTQDTYGHNALYYAKQLPPEYPEKDNLIGLLIAAEKL